LHSTKSKNKKYPKLLKISEFNIQMMKSGFNHGFFIFLWQLKI